MSKSGKAGVAILGLGTIGSAVSRLLQERHDAIAESYGMDLVIRQVLERGPERAERGNLEGNLVTDDIDAIIGNPSVDVIVETLGGESPAAGYIEQALRAGKYVVTANKEAVAKHFDRLQRAAHASGAALLFEASVGGGIPLLVSYRQILAANNVTRIRGILNGTTNYILTQMTTAGTSFDAALTKAQELGYAEPDPTADVDGYDAAYKISILASIMSGSHVHPDTVELTGIRGVTSDEIENAGEEATVVKLIGEASLEGSNVTVSVAPQQISRENLLAHVSDNYNAVELVGDGVGPVVLCGQGAGPAPTASAVVSDVLEALRAGSAANIPWR